MNFKEEIYAANEEQVSCVFCNQYISLAHMYKLGHPVLSVDDLFTLMFNYIASHSC